MLPTDRGSVGEQRRIRSLADRPEMLDGIGDVGGVPVNDRGDDQVQSGRAILQRLVGPVDDPALAERADRLRQDVPLLALVSPVWQRRRRSGFSSQSSMKKVRSIRPISWSARSTWFWRS